MTSCRFGYAAKQNIPRCRNMQLLKDPMAKSQLNASVGVAISTLAIRFIGEHGACETECGNNTCLGDAASVTKECDVQPASSGMVVGIAMGR